MKVQVLGSGCPTCKHLYELTKKAAAELDLTAEVEYIPDITKIVEMGIMASPVLAVDGKAVMIGSTNNIDKIKDALVASTNTQNNSCDCDGSNPNCTCG